MPLVRMLTSWATSQHSFDEGEEVQASVDEVRSWLPAGIAVLVTEDRLTPEREQRREVRRGPGRPRTRR